MAKKNTKAENEEWKNHTCGECARCEPYMRFETLSVHGRKPTMAVCPLVTERRVLLSETACREFRLKRLVYK